jgi:RHS repeat-associated protein
MTEMAMMTTKSGTTYNWVHSNVTASGHLIATYDNTGQGLHFYLNDALGSRRFQTDASGIPEQACQSLPFGDQLYCTGSLSTPTEHHFTGKERDAESGLDYFGARYYASSMGRFMSPDWSKYPAPVPYASFANPQSLNLYTYVSNNPLRFSDPNRHHQECAPDTSSTDKNGVLTVTAGACHEVPDWWQFQGVRRWIGHHPKTVKATFGVVNAATVVSGLLDGGTSELAVPEELVLEEAIEEAGELAAEEGATAAETAEAGTGGEATAGSAQMKKLSNGEIFVKPKAGNGPGEPTGLNIKDYK